MVDEEAIMRPAKLVPSKVLIRQTIKAVAAKESYPNSPWVVRKEIAAEYEVDTEMPYELKQAKEDYHRRRMSGGPDAKRQKRDGETAQQRKEREREERRLKREEEKRRKALEAKYPMIDEDLEQVRNPLILL